MSSGPFLGFEAVRSLGRRIKRLGKRIDLPISINWTCPVLCPCLLVLLWIAMIPTVAMGRIVTTQPVEKGKNPLPEISIQLLGPLSSLKGRTWPRGYDWVYNKPDQPLIMATVDEPHELTVYLPSGKTLRHLSKLTFFTQDSGKVLTVKLVPNIHLLTFQEAIVELEELLKEWDATPSENETNKTTKQRIAHWKTEGNLKTGPWALSKSGGAVIHGESKAYIFFKIRPGDGGWFLSITIGPTTKIIQEFIQSHGTRFPASQPITQPTTGQSERP